MYHPRDCSQRSWKCPHPNWIIGRWRTWMSFLSTKLCGSKGGASAWSGLLHHNWGWILVRVDLEESKTTRKTPSPKFKPNFPFFFFLQIKLKIKSQFYQFLLLSTKSFSTFSLMKVRVECTWKESVWVESNGTSEEAQDAQIEVWNDWPTAPDTINRSQWLEWSESQAW